MSSVAILGAGPIGAAVAHRLAERGEVRDIRFVDANATVARGKALDIQQSGPIEQFDTRLSATSDVLAATGATVIVVADSIDDGEWSGERGVALIAELARGGTTAPLVFAGPAQTGLMEACYRELKIPANRLVGTGPSAIVGIVRALAGIELNATSVEVTVVGQPPTFVVGWSAASAAGSLLTDRIPGHRLLAISASLPKLWPPGPQSIAAATAPVVEGLILGSRRLHPALTVLDGELGTRGAAVLLPLSLGRHRVLSHTMPSLSPQERTTLINGLGLKA